MASIFAPGIVFVLVRKVRYASYHQESRLPGRLESCTSQSACFHFNPYEFRPIASKALKHVFGRYYLVTCCHWTDAILRFSSLRAPLFDQVKPVLSLVPGRL